jgi:hypothetical protein
MTFPFRFASDPVPEDENAPDQPVELIAERLKSLIAGHQQVNGGSWKATVIYLGIKEWNRFQEEAHTDEYIGEREWELLGDGILEWKYAKDKSILIRLLADTETYCRVLGEKEATQ